MRAEDTAAEMDWKNSNRASSVPSKSGGGVDTKKAEGGNGSRQRYSKKREPAGSRQRQDNGVVRKPAPQKSRTSTDKRPRSRGFFNDRQREEVVYDDGAELGSALQKGSKKGNLNHLLNFTYAPREGYDGVGCRGGYPMGRRGRYKPRYNKEQFLQANCQFIVREGGDYIVHSADPDKLVDWELIEQVRVSSPELPSCPICLHPPAAAKITRCGHVYCWSCILHYLALGEKNWRKCPICYDAIHRGDLKSVQTVFVSRYSAGDEITFQLMKKEKGSTQVYPNLYWTQRDGQPLSLSEKDLWPTASLLMASVVEVRELIIGPERVALERQLAAETEDSEVCFIEGALAQLEERESKLKRKQKTKEEVMELIEKVQLEEPAEEVVEHQLDVSSISHDKPIIQYSNAFSDEEEEIEEMSESCQGEGIHVVDENGNRSESGSKSIGDNSTTANTDDEVANTAERANTAEGESVDAEDLAGENSGELVEEREAACLPVEEAVEYLSLSPEEQESPQPQNTTFYYFYQAKTGQHIYIHAVNAHCLVREYGSLENCPETITATVVEIETVFMTEELRRRLRYLCHLPLTCEFQVVEVELKPPQVSAETLAHFSGELERRRRQRQKKSRDERKQDRQIKEQEKRSQGIYPGLRIPLTSRSQFPATAGVQGSETNRVASPVLSQSTNSSPTNSPTGGTGLNVFASEFTPCSGISPSSPPSWPAESTTLSFATMLKEGKALPSVWPKAVKASGPTTAGAQPVRRRADSDVSDPEDKVPVPEYQSTFKDAIQQAFDNLNKETEQDGKQQQTGKKKKQKKKLLFTTSMTRGK